jgi:hypothetical protein
MNQTTHDHFNDQLRRRTMKMAASIRNMANIHFYLQSGKVNNKGQQPIIMRITIILPLMNGSAY